MPQFSSLFRKWSVVICAILLFILTQAYAETNSTSLTNDDTSNDDNVEGLGPTVILLFMFVGLGLGVILMQFLSVMGEVNYSLNTH